jgi:hypothetical protein
MINQFNNYLDQINKKQVYTVVIELINVWIILLKNYYQHSLTIFCLLYVFMKIVKIPYILLQ